MILLARQVVWWGLAICLLASGAWAEDEVERPDGATFALVRNKVLVPVYLGTAGPYPFLLDSTASAIALDSTLAQALKLPTVNTPDGPALVSLPELATSELRLPTQEVATVDLAARSAGVGTALAGILPCRLGSPALVLDFRELSFAFGLLPDRQTTYPVATKLRTDEHGFNVDVLFNGKYMTAARLDTTYGPTLGLPEAQALELGLVGSTTPRLEFEPAPAGQTALDSNVQIRLRSIQIAGAEVQQPLCTLLPSGTLPVIGVGFLKHFRVRFDYEAEILALAPLEDGPALDKPIVGYGVVLGGLVDGQWILHVAVNSPAYRAGIKSGDRLVSIDGVPMVGLPYADVAGRLAGKRADRAKLGVMRGDKPIETELTAEALL